MAMEMSTRDSDAQRGQVTGNLSMGSFMVFLSLRCIELQTIGRSFANEHYKGVKT
jgi:hypothetical protein